jgi:hypothetical protein
MSTKRPIERTMQYVRGKAIVRSRNLEALGIPREYPSRGIKINVCPRLLRKNSSLNAMWSRSVLVVSYKTVWLIDGVLSTIGNSIGTPSTITVSALFQIVSGQYSDLSSLY